MPELAQLLDAVLAMDEGAAAVAARPLPRTQIRVRGGGGRLPVTGNRFDPRNADMGSEKYTRIAQTVLETSGLISTYSYRSGRNIVALIRPRPPLSTLSQILIAFVLGVAISLMGNLLLPEAGRTYALEKIVTPLSDVYLALLNGMAGWPPVALTSWA